MKEYVKMINETKIIMRPKVWFGNFITGFICTCLCIIAGIQNVLVLIKKDVQQGTLTGTTFISMLLFLIFITAFIFIMIAYSEVIVLKENKIEIIYLWIFKKTISTTKIEHAEIVKKKNKVKYYDSVKLFVDGKAKRIINSPSEMWKNYDEFMLFLQANKIKIERV